MQITGDSGATYERKVKLSKHFILCNFSSAKLVLFLFI